MTCWSPTAGRTRCGIIIPRHPRGGVLSLLTAVSLEYLPSFRSANHCFLGLVAPQQFAGRIGHILRRQMDGAQFIAELHNLIHIHFFGESPRLFVPSEFLQNHTISRGNGVLIVLLHPVQ